MYLPSLLPVGKLSPYDQKLGWSTGVRSIERGSNLGARPRSSGEEEEVRSGGCGQRGLIQLGRAPAGVSRTELEKDIKMGNEGSVMLLQIPHFVG